MDYKSMAKEAYSQLIESSTFESVSRILKVDINDLYRYDCLSIISILYLFAEDDNRHDIEQRTDYILGIDDSGIIIQNIINDMDEELIVDLLFAQTPYAASYLSRQSDLDFSKINISMSMIEIMEMILVGIFCPDGSMKVNSRTYLLFAYADIAKNNFKKICINYKTIFTGSIPSFEDIAGLYHEKFDIDSEYFDDVSGCDNAERFFSFVRDSILNKNIYGLFKKSQKNPKVMSYSKEEVLEYANFISKFENDNLVTIDISNEDEANNYCIELDKFDWKMVAILLQYAIGEYGDYRRGHYCEEYPADYIVLFTIIAIIITTGESIETIMDTKIEDFDSTEGILTLTKINVDNVEIKKFKLLPSICQGIIDELIAGRAGRDFLFDLNNPVLLTSFMSSPSIDIDEAEKEIKKITQNLLGRKYSTKELQLFGIKYLLLLSHDAEYVHENLLKNNLKFESTDRIIDEINFKANMSSNELFEFLVTDFEIDYDLYEKYVKDDSDYQFSYYKSPCYTVIDKWSSYSSSRMHIEY